MATNSLLLPSILSTMTRLRVRRLVVVVAGAAMMIGCVAAAWRLNVAFYAVWPNVLFESRLQYLFPFAPFTALFVFISGYCWTRWLRASAWESMAALVINEVILFGLVVLVGWGGLLGVADDFAWLLWAIFSLPFAPWWLLSTWAGRHGAVSR